jgi:NACHT domain- and WD repeat-containing protein
LIANIYPKLKTYCKSEYNIDFQILDMRWGINNELTNAHMATTICLDEVKKCQKYSLGPNFIVLLSHRYGRICLPTRIVADEYELIRSEINKSINNFDLKFKYEYNTDIIVESDNILDYCYELDENEKPFRYRLKYLNKIFPNINHKEAEFDKLWNSLEEKLGDSLRKAAKLCYDNKLINKTQFERYFVSVTEKEIFNGILNGKNLADNVLFFEREIIDIEQNIALNPILAGRFIDLDKYNKVDTNTKQLLNDLKYTKIPAKLPQSNIFKLKVNWSQKEGISQETHSEYIKTFSELFFEQCKKLIDRNNLKHDDYFQKLNIKDQILFKEILYHAQFCNDTVLKFHGREDILNKIKDYVLLNDNEYNIPLVLHGESGCGKTALLAKSVSQILDYVPDPFNYSIILRFLGTTPSTSNIINTYHSIIHQISRIFNFKLDLKESKEDKEGLKEHLMFQFMLISKHYSNRKLIIVLDSIDQLNSSDYDLKWLIPKFPPNIKIIYSTLPNHANIYHNLRSMIIDPINFIEIANLNFDLSKLILNDWLLKSGRQLSMKQWNIIDTMFNRANLLPLYVKVIFDIVTKWHSFYEPDSGFSMCLKIDDIIRYLFGLLELEHGKLLFSRAVVYMTSFQDGISESEIEDILSLDDEVLYDVFQFHSPPIRKLPSALVNNFITFKLHPFISTPSTYENSSY